MSGVENAGDDLAVLCQNVSNCWQLGAHSIVPYLSSTFVGFADDLLPVEAALREGEQAEQLCAGHDVSGADADDVCELLNYRAAFDLVSDHLSSWWPGSRLSSRR
jgi:hypothetical protein